MPFPPSDSPGNSGDAPPSPRRATLMEVVNAVLWSFFGVRKGDAMRRDAVTIRPHQVIIVGIVIAAILVATLVILVRIITRGA